MYLCERVGGLAAAEQGGGGVSTGLLVGGGRGGSLPGLLPSHLEVVDVPSVEGCLAVGKVEPAGSCPSIIAGRRPSAVCCNAVGHNEYSMHSSKW